MQISKHESKNWLEWTVFALGGALLLAVIGVLAWEAWHDSPHKPAIVEVSLERSQKRGDHFAVPVLVSNRGGETAEGVQVEVTLINADGEEERSQFEIQFLPQQARKRGYAIFATDPAAAKSLTARPLGHRQP